MNIAQKDISTGTPITNQIYAAKDFGIGRSSRRSNIPFTPRATRTIPISKLTKEENSNGSLAPFISSSIFRTNPKQQSAPKKMRKKQAIMLGLGVFRVFISARLEFNRLKVRNFFELFL